jgi:hypothetical protein
MAYQEVLGADSLNVGRVKINDNVTELYGIPTASITGAVSLSASALGKVHICTGTSSDYTVDLPTAVGNTGDTIAIKGAAALTKIVTVAGVSGQTIDAEANRKIASGGLFVLVSDGTNWILVNEIGSWIAYTPVWTGFSADPTLLYSSYFREGKKCNIIITTSSSGTSNATTMTATLPFNAVAASINLCIIVNNGTAAAGQARTGAGTNVLTFYATAALGAFTGSGSKSGNVQIAYMVS